jgi:hypothetical protein
VAETTSRGSEKYGQLNNASLYYAKISGHGV